MGIQVSRSKDCGNSPKQKFLQDLAIAIACANVDLLSQVVADDVSWHQSGRAPIRGKTDFLKALKRFGPVDTLEIVDVVSHGRKGAVRGSFTVSGKRRVFSHFFEFTNTRCTQVLAINSMSVASR